MNNAQKWRDFYKNAEAIATCMSPSWLAEGCPKCGSRKWEVTSDCYAYCKGCSKGYPTDFPFTKSGEILSDLDFSETLNKCTILKIL